jgi:hypothetical protein
VSAWLRAQVATMRDPAAGSPVASAGVDPGSRGLARCDHFRLHDRLSQLTELTFEQIVVRAGIERASFAPRTALLAERVLDIAQLAALDQTLCRRLAAELDRRAPWTRR